MYPVIYAVGTAYAAPRLHYTPEGKALTSFSIEVRRFYTDNQNVVVEEYGFLAVICQDDLAEVINNELKPNQLVLVKGELICDEKGNPRIFDRNGVPGSAYEAKAFTIIPLAELTEDQAKATTGFMEVIVLGNLVADPETRPVGSTKVTTFRVATNKGRDLPALWTRLNAWGKAGDFVAKYFKKGKPIIAFARLNFDRPGTDGTPAQNKGGPRLWVANNETRAGFDLTVATTSFVPGGGGGGNGNSPSFDDSQSPDNDPYSTPQDFENF